tara:strand:+ start:1127 stop:1768 length:642 start_codon:yes stop_codon:yes gene_type:complete
MKVKIEKEGKIEEFNLIKDWSDVSLESWGKLIDFKKGSPTKEALTTINALSDIPEKYVKSLSVKNVATLLSKVADIQAEKNTVLRNVIRIDKVNYGFHPNLDEITIGEYADLETFIEQGFEKSMPEIMAVLYRPITERDKNGYTIEAYDGNIEERVKEMKKMKAKDVQGALVFFWSFASVLSLTLQSFSLEVMNKMMEENLTETLLSAGVGSE